MLCYPFWLMFTFEVPATTYFQHFLALHLQQKYDSTKRRSLRNLEESRCYWAMWKKLKQIYRLLPVGSLQIFTEVSTGMLLWTQKLINSKICTCVYAFHDQIFSHLFSNNIYHIVSMCKLFYEIICCRSIFLSRRVQSPVHQTSTTRVKPVSIKFALHLDFLCLLT